MVNKWQDYETGPDAPDVINAVIENPTGTQNKNTNTIRRKNQ